MVGISDLNVSVLPFQEVLPGSTLPCYLKYDARRVGLYVLCNERILNFKTNFLFHKLISSKQTLGARGFLSFTENHIPIQVIGELYKPPLPH